MRSQLVVTAAVIRRPADGHILLAQRKPEAHNGLLWEFPGGKLEWGEDPRAGLAREIREELGIEITVGTALEVVAHTYEDRHIILLGYLCEHIHGDVQRLDVHDVHWVPPSALLTYDLAPADVPIVHRLLAQAP